MIARASVLATAFWLTVAAGAQPAAPPEAAPESPVASPPVVPAAPTMRVVLRTSAGTIVIAVETMRAKLTAANFLRYVDQKRFDGTRFYRALNLGGAPGVGLIQGGVQGDTKRTLKPIAHEPTSATGLTHDDGAVSMARAAPGTATGDFFIVVGAIPSLDAASTKGGDPGYAVFGHVVEGADVVRKLLAAPVSPTAGQGALKGQMLAAPVVIISARRGVRSSSQ